MVGDARIRLEGQLELLEEGVVALESGIRAALRGGDFGPLKLALDMRLGQTRQQVAKLAAEAPELSKLECTYQRLHAQAATVVRERARLLEVAELPLSSSVSALVADPVVYEGRARHPLAWVGFGVAAALIAVEVGLFRSPAPLLVHGVAAGVFAALVAFAPRLIVTRQRVFIAGQVLRLENIELVHIKRLLIRSTKPYLLTARLHDGSEVEVRLPYAPEAFISALRTAQVPVTRISWWGSHSPARGA